MRQTVRRQPWQTLVIICIVAMCASILLTSWALYSRFTETNDRRETQRELNLEMRRFRTQQLRLNRRIDAIALGYCQEIEKLKTERREAAIEAFRNRGRNLRLFGLERTREIEEILTQNYKRSLEKFKAQGCPRILPGD